MKQILSLLVTLTAFSAFAQIQAVPAPTTPEETAATAPATPATEGAIQATPAAPTAKPAAAAGTSTVKAKAPEKFKPSWGGNALVDVSRQTDINDSRILDADNPDKRVDYSLTIAAALKY